MSNLKLKPQHCSILGNAVVIYFILSCVLVYSSACSRSEENRSDILINIDNSKTKDYFIEDIFSSYELIELKHLIGKVDQVIKFNTHWVVIDKMMESIKVFDTEGNFKTAVKGDLLDNGVTIQPVCMVVNEDNQLIFYDAGNESIFILNKNYQVVSVKKADFYMHKIYRVDSGFVVYKNQTEQNNEEAKYHYDIIICDKNFTPITKLRPFKIELNIPRIWLNFEDPITVTNNNLQFFAPLSDSVWNYNLITKEESIKKIQFAKNGLRSEHLIGVDVLNPMQVMENVFGKYSLISSKKYSGKMASGIRYIEKSKQHFSLHLLKNNQILELKSLKTRVEDKNIIIPFPSYFFDTEIISVLDSDNYEQLNLPNDKLEHNLINNVILKGRTYLYIYKNIKNEIN